jgi:hypothetical protein
MASLPAEGRSVCYGLSAEADRLAFFALSLLCAPTLSAAVDFLLAKAHLGGQDAEPQRDCGSLKFLDTLPARRSG